MKLTPKTAVLSIIAAPFAFINLFLIVATPMSIVEALQSPKTFSKASVSPSVTPTPIAKPSVTPRKPIKSYADEYAPEHKAPSVKGVTSEGFHYIFDGKQYIPDPDFADESTKTPTPTSQSVKKDESANPETWTSSRPNATITGSTEVTSMFGERKYSILRRGQLIRLTGDREGNKVGIEGDYGFFKTTGYVDIADIKSINLLDQTP